MRLSVAPALLVFLLALSPAGSFAAEDQKPAPRDDSGQGLEEIGREYFGGTTAREQQPVISQLLRNREKLGLSDEQVSKLEQIRSDFEKETIRNEADIRVAEIDLNNLLHASSADMGKVEAKIREVERLRGDLRIARIRAIEKGKALLSPDQRKKFQDLILDQRFSRSQSWGGR
jgi:Spy/CpxP family protein refolding chaperone